MQRHRVLAFTSAALLLQLLSPIVAAHGHDDDHHDGGGMHESMHGGNDSSIPSAPPSYFSHPDYRRWMFAHIIFMVLSWVVVLPIGVMMSIVRSRFAMPVNLVFLVLNAVGLLVGTVYNNRTPDLYENNSHHKSGWAFTWIACAWVVMGVVDLYARKARASGGPHPPHAGRHSVSFAAIAQYQRIQSAEAQPSRWSDDSGQGTERNTSSLYGHSRSPSVQSENQQFAAQSPTLHEDDIDDGDDGSYDAAEKRGFLRSVAVDRFLSRNVPRVAAGRTFKAVRLLYALIERTILILSFVALTTGLAVYGGIFRGNDIFNGLAHFIKGGIFFWYGLLVLGRWSGSFADLGWAWNVKPPAEVVGRRKAAVPSAEFLESLLIFIYGASNVFLEHLGAWGGEWSPMDLEHVSITIMFFGGGLLGMLIESRKVRDLLNAPIHSIRDGDRYPNEKNEAWQAPKTYRFPMNPLPALIILLLGMMMSSHHQASAVSAEVHKLWGSLFAGASLARGFTYILMYLSPPASYLPSRPPTELITAFCLISGGLIFMGSNRTASDLDIQNRNTVMTLEAYGLDAMFIFVVTMGFTGLLMAWETLVIAIKGWAVRHEGSRRAFSTRTPGAGSAA
ncbi:hypothetical protein BDY21DRAFT_362361 [Lineolata rhizophorae]|uniref:Integral membrane protein n=1 Tax=Lineolata rhizophorae TaxID=578093 RepID=A0A6A6P711_9PEZI|nr:hypothetical protein BDY21DRAFT_362361 [Lineolata rhizophorae]